ncbi:hypothetical protein F2P79_000390 [Pimephales promelas]|nr:hypothetical protein F2P79_000390 [Pimephales promelas]KAG1972309.1 hypothetical protein F2P79_000390 [Pimephales promelas]KAG1972310.1 hypothetical protein F2P79_000390 [Pimephales promelas]
MLSIKGRVVEASTTLEFDQRAPNRILCLQGLSLMALYQNPEIGVMKTRWRSTLFRALEVKPTFAPQVIASCAFLHNVCLDNGDTLDPDEDIARDDLDPHPPHEPMAFNEASGNAARDALAAQVSGDVQAT